MTSYTITYTPYKNGCQLGSGCEFEFEAAEFIDAISHAYMECLNSMKCELMTCVTHTMHSGESYLIEVQSQSNPDEYDCDELSYDDVWMGM